MFKSFLCQPTMVIDQALTQDFLKIEEVFKHMPLREAFQLQHTNRRHGEKYRFFHLDTVKTSFLMRNLPIDSRNLGIFPNRKDYSLQFPKKSWRGFPLLPGSLRLLTYFKIFLSPSKKWPWSFQNIWILFWIEGEIQWAKKDKFCKSTYGSLKNSKDIYLVDK